MSNVAIAPFKALIVAGMAWHLGLLGLRVGALDPCMVRLRIRAVSPIDQEFAMGEA